uniref:Aspartate dehydrogenase domain-containing protein n=1 Tax=Meloidogyne javanica TaxID=6303 RepID=A0A915MYK7_MELJA
MSINYQLLKILLNFRQNDLTSFTEIHFRLYADAKQNGDYGPCIAHYYSIMSKLIEKYFCKSFHFVPPLPSQNQQKFNLFETNNFIKTTKFSGNSISNSLKELHLLIGECLQLNNKTKCLDIGCGIGNVIEHLAFTGAQFIGINRKCQLLQANCSKNIPLSKNSQDAAYAIYSLKYLPKLEIIFSELYRVLKPEGLLLVYDLLKTDKYNEDNVEHRKLLSELEMSCGMPPLHSRNEIIKEANNANFVLIKAIDLDKKVGKPFYYCFSHSKIFMWMIRSSLIEQLINLAQFLHIQQQNNQKRIGIIGFGRLGRTEDSNEGVLPLSELNEENLKDIDLIIEVSHPDIIHNYANTILKHADLFVKFILLIGSVTALAVEKTYNEIKAGTVRQLCLMAPNNVNSMASAGIAAHTLGLDHTRAKLIVDPE